MFAINFWTVEDGCGAALYDDSGIIISPNYPNEYNHNAECIWTIQLPQPGQIEFEVTDLQLQGIGKCDFDYVEVRSDMHLFHVVYSTVLCPLKL